MLRSLANIIPPGTIILYADDDIPYNYLKCNGAEYDKSDYQQLFNVIGYRYSPYSSGNKFYVPDLRGLFVRCVDSSSSVGDTQQDEIGSHSHSASSQDAGSHSHGMDQAGSHSHTMEQAGDHHHDFEQGSAESFGEYNGLPSGGQGGAQTSYETDNNGQHTHSIDSAGQHTHSIESAGSHSHTITVGSTGGSETRPKNMALHYIIKF